METQNCRVLGFSPPEESSTAETAEAAVVNALSTVVGGHDHLTAHKGQAPQVPRLGPILLIFGTMGCRALWFRVLIQGLRF